METYTCDAANRLLGKTGVSYTWEANGNLASKTVKGKGKKGTTTTYRYDGDHRLLEVQRGGVTVARFTYDPFGRRVSKTTSAGTAYYVYDGEDILAEVDAAGNLLTYYVHGPGIDEPLAMIRGGQTYYYHADALGTITHLTKSSGAIAQRYDYDSFGNITSQSGTITQPYTFTSREWDAETGLYYYRARYYDPTIGRFLSEDPLLLPRGVLNVPELLEDLLYDPSLFQPYAYTTNNPPNYTDPFGLSIIAPVPPGTDPDDLVIGGGFVIKSRKALLHCRRYGNCGAQFAADLAKCTTKTVDKVRRDPEIVDTGFMRCVRIAWGTFKRCLRGYPPLTRVK